MTHIGRVRFKLAEVLTEYFGQRIYPEEFRIVTGIWKRVDVYRWEVRVRRNYQGYDIYLGCWRSMTEFLRNYKNGIEVDWDDSTISTITEN